MELKDSILELMRRKDYVPLRLDELYKALGGGGKVFSRLKKVVPRMVRDGEIAQVKRDRYCLPADANLVSGKIVFRSGGSAKVGYSRDSVPGPYWSMGRKEKSTGFPSRTSITGV